MGERDGVVGVDEGVDRRQAAAGEHVLDQPLDRGAVARPLDAEGAVGLPPGGDAGNLRQLHVRPLRPAGRDARGDERGKLRRPLGAHLDVLGNHDPDAKLGKRADDFGDVDLHDAVRVARRREKSKVR